MAKKKFIHSVSTVGSKMYEEKAFIYGVSEEHTLTSKDASGLAVLGASREVVRSKENLDKQKDPRGDKYHPLLKSTWKKKKTKKIMTETGRLSQSYLMKDEGKGEVSINNTAPYAVYHQNETKRSDGAIFRRPVLTDTTTGLGESATGMSWKSGGYRWVTPEQAIRNIHMHKDAKQGMKEFRDTIDDAVKQVKKAGVKTKIKR